MTSNDYGKLGEGLARLHAITNTEFGLDYDNFIGSLSQKNTRHNDWVNFYVNTKLKPQLQLALQNGLLKQSDIPEHDVLTDRVLNLSGEIRPSLIHGDLWHGNFLIGVNNKPYLFDPACYFGDPRMDIAMSKLFGGFDDRFYEAYYSTMGIKKIGKDLLDLYQLYYLLVHLNIFGSSYYSSVKAILNRHFF